MNNFTDRLHINNNW